MAEGKKRAAVKARKAGAQTAKGTRRRQRTNNGVRTDDGRAYGSRAISRTSGQGLSITVQIPPLRRPKNLDKATPDKTALSLRQRIIRPLILLPLLLIIGIVSFTGGTPNEPTSADQSTAVSAAEKTEPSFQPLIPSAEKASATKFDGKRNLVSYTMTFSGVRVTVSQQALPAHFKKDPHAIKGAADNIRAKEQIDTGSGPLFVATNEEGGDQMAVYAGKEVLLFIHTDRKLDPISWKSFIELLQPKSWSELI